MRKRVCLVIPMFNESNSILKVLGEISKSGYQVICIDDGSEDDCGKMASAAGAYVLRHPLNLGQGAALETGFEFIRRNQKLFDFVFTFDADGQHSIEDVEIALDKFRENSNLSVILGSRFLGQEFYGGKIKECVLRIMAFLARFTIRIKVTDRHNGFRGFRTTALHSIRLENSGFGHADEILRKIADAKLQYSEVATTIKYTKYSVQKGQRLTNGFKLVFDRFMGAK